MSKNDIKSILTDEGSLPTNLVRKTNLRVRFTTFQLFCIPIFRLIEVSPESQGKSENAPKSQVKGANAP